MKKFVNLLTIIRLISTFIIPFVWNKISSISLIIIVSLILLTDFFDGFLARKFHVQTLFGSCLDMLADKTFGIVLVLILSTKYKLLYLVFALELFIAIINVVGSLLGATTKSSFLGKTKMWIMGIAIFVAMYHLFEIELTYLKFLNNIITKEFVDTMVTVAIGSQIMVTVDYFRHISKNIFSNHKDPEYQKFAYKFKNKKIIKKVLFDTNFYLKNKNQPLSKLFFTEKVN